MSDIKTHIIKGVSLLHIDEAVAKRGMNLK